jgi:GH15 family glucan-1,4-alpha-glucosidase
LGRDDWTDYQLDGYGAWLWVLVQHCREVDAALWDEIRPAVRVTVRYLTALWQSPNYDCWEEFRDRVHTATLAALYGGLSAVAALDPDLVPAGLPDAIRSHVLAHGVADYGGLSKFIPQDAAPGKRVDASLLWTAVPFGLVAVDSPVFQATLRQIEHDICGPGGGVYRYRDDTYFGGGQWPLLTAWLGWVYVQLGRIDDARTLRDWIVRQATHDGHMPEQVDGHLLEPSMYAGWVEKWGDPANPLLWSHAMYLILEHALHQQGSES